MRVFVRILSLLLGIALAAAGVLLALEVAWAWAQPGSGSLLVPWNDWRARLADLNWESTSVRIVAAITAAVGLILLLMAFSARTRDISLRDPGPGITVRTSPRSLARIVGSRVRAEDNVSAASVTATAKHVRVRATSRLATEAQLRPRLLDVVRETLDDLPLARAPKVTVVVDSPKDRS
ncbi:MAG: alkaline shock response membrane anchor protein AmaP [Actinomycetota bacterium]|nr:alkaline shock response membrane anchor protein AmaP [Actinomycetota bacterium]